MGILGRFCGMLPSSRTSMYAPVSAPLKSYNMPHYLRFMSKWASQADFEPVNSSKRGIFPLLLVF